MEKLTIAQAFLRLAEKGFKLGRGTTDLKKGKTFYMVTDTQSGDTFEMYTDQIKELIAV